MENCNEYAYKQQFLFDKIVDLTDIYENIKNDYRYMNSNDISNDLEYSNSLQLVKGTINKLLEENSAEKTIAKKGENIQLILTLLH